MKRGKEAKPPKGFRDSIDICGRKFSIKYYDSVIGSDEGELDGLFLHGEREILISVRGRTREHLADVLWHEIMGHFPVSYVGEGNNQEATVLVLELTQPYILRSNHWFWALFGGGK